MQPYTDYRPYLMKCRRDQFSRYQMAIPHNHQTVNARYGGSLGISRNALYITDYQSYTVRVTNLSWYVTTFVGINMPDWCYVQR